MRPLPQNKLNPKIKNVWRICDAAGILAIFALGFVPFAVALAADELQTWIRFALAVEVAACAIALILVLVVLPPIRFARWRYRLTDDYLDIAKGIVWRHRSIIPFIRVQNTDTRQGPVLRVFGLASVTVSTAAGEHEIPGLAVEQAEELRDRAAELARIAREDV